MKKRVIPIVILIIWLVGLTVDIGWYRFMVIPKVKTAEPEVTYYNMQRVSGEHALYLPGVEMNSGEYEWVIDYSCKKSQSYEMVAVYPDGTTATIDEGKLSASKKQLALNYNLDEGIPYTSYYLYFNYNGRGSLAIKHMTVTHDGEVCQEAEASSVISPGYGAVNGKIKKLPYHYATYTFDGTLEGNREDILKSTSFDGENVFVNVTQEDLWGHRPRIYENGNKEDFSFLDFALDGEYAVPVAIADETTAYVDVYKLVEDDTDIEVYAQRTNTWYEFKQNLPKLFVLLIVVFLILSYLWMHNRFIHIGLFFFVPSVALGILASLIVFLNYLPFYVDFYMSLAVYGACCGLVVSLFYVFHRSVQQMIPYGLLVAGSMLFLCLRDELFTVEQSMHEHIIVALLGMACLLPAILVAVIDSSEDGGFLGGGRTKKLHAWQVILLVLGTVLWVAVCILSTLEGFLIDLFAGISFEEILFHLKVPMEGTSSSMVLEYFKYAKIPLLVLLAVVVLLVIFLITRKNLRQNWIFAVGLFVTSVAASISLWVGWYQNMHLDEYFAAQKNASTFIEDNYVAPEDVALTFPAKKRNLIYIYCESMESTYIDKEDGGAMDENWIPNLTELAKENTNFSQDDLVGGFYSPYDTTWTVAALVCQTSGLPMKVPVDGNSYGETSFLPGAVVLGDILEEQGYNQEFMCGSDASFAGRKQYFEGHGNYKIWDYIYAGEQKKIPAGYGVWWGFEDEKLFAFAKEELTRMSKEEEPFNFTMLTADTHFVDGYVCRLCQEESDKQYENVMRCSDRQITEFVSWVKEQPFYENTTIVIAGDHLTMDNNYTLAYYDGSKQRTVYNCIINPATTGDIAVTKNRKFTTMDMFPTTLSAMGVSIEGNRLGLGTDLFSGTQTLAEEYGYKYLDDEIMCLSKFYNKEFVEP